MDGSATVKEHPVVLRFAGLYPHQLAGYQAHRTRKGGDLSHVDPTRSHLNRPLIGNADWAAQALAEIREMTDENYADELAALEKRKRRKDIKRRMVEGPKQPWRPTRHGPMREVILTANREYFDADLGDFFGEGGNSREQAFEERAVAWLRENFGDDVIHARADRDEAAYHIHAVIMPRATVEIAKPKAKTKVATTTRRMLQPSIHPLIENYEAAQDSVGEWFQDIGLVRGERRAEAIRQARANGETPPKRRYHARTATWRAAEERRLARQAADQEARSTDLDARAAAVADREDEADTVLAVAAGLGNGSLDLDTAAAEPQLTAGQGAAAAPTPPPDPETLRRRSPRGVARAVAAFGAAWARLRTRAGAEARAELGDAVDQIRHADDTIVEIAARLPEAERAEIARVRRSLTARLQDLGRWVRGDGKARDRRADPREES
jgi:hypothetical protein